MMTGAEIFQWMQMHPDECASAVADAYSSWSPGDEGALGNFGDLLRQEINYQILKLAGLTSQREDGQPANGSGS